MGDQFWVVKMRAIAKILVLLMGLTVGCGIPKDPENTFYSAKSTGLKVGFVENPPFTEGENGKFDGVEVNLLKSFATENNLKITFVEGSESNLIEQLSNREIDILIGGFDKKTVWKEKAGSAKPYDDTHIILVPKGENRLVYELESFLQNQRKS